MTTIDTFPARWIELEGAANARDLGGLPTADGALTRPDRLIRSDNLQGLTPRDVGTLVGAHRLRAVADLRTRVEVAAEGPGPLVADPRVQIAHFSLFPEAGRTTDAAADSAADGDAGPVVLPWQRDRERGERGGDRPAASAIYLRYLADRADSVVAALRLIAATDGAVIVHCAAGKDRTGVVTALALGAVGVTREAIVADYAASSERIEAIFGRLLTSSTYADDLAGQQMDAHRSRPETMRRLLDVLDAEHGGVPGWLRAHGWSGDDSAALRRHLLG